MPKRACHRELCAHGEGLADDTAVSRLRRAHDANLSSPANAVDGGSGRRLPRPRWHVPLPRRCQRSKRAQLRAPRIRARRDSRSGRHAALREDDEPARTLPIDATGRAHPGTPRAPGEPATRGTANEDAELLADGSRCRARRDGDERQQTQDTRAGSRVFCRGVFYGPFEPGSVA